VSYEGGRRGRKIGGREGGRDVPSDVDIDHACDWFLVARDEDGSEDLLDCVVEGLPFPTVLDRRPGGALGGGREGGRKREVSVSSVYRGFETEAAVADTRYKCKG